MGIYRHDGSVESANLPIYLYGRDFNIYRAQITKIYYTDDPLNISKGSVNPQILYDAIIIGGQNDGKKLVNVRNTQRSSGSQYNRSDISLQPSQNSYNAENLNYKNPADQVGDIVYIAFLEGNPLYPIIIGYGVNGLDNNGTTTAQGPQKVDSYNGVTQTIDNSGNFSISTTGGSVSNGIFIPQQNQVNGEISITGETINLNVNNGNVTIAINAPNDTIQLKTKGGAELNLVGGKVALGAGSNELLDLLDQILTQLEALTVQQVVAPGTYTSSNVTAIGAPVTVTLGPADSGTPTNASSFSSIQSKLDQIKGNL